jgi:uncharacterized protein (DUF362 family)
MIVKTRREFLASSAAAAGLLALGPQRLLAAEAARDMAIARWGGAKDLTQEQLKALAPEKMKQIAVQLTEKAIEAVGGLKRFVGRGSVVWVKPNIGWDRTPEQAANTNPDVVATIVRLCFEAGAKAVKVGDNPCDLVTKTYVTSGIPDAVRPLGAEVLMLDRSRFRETDIKGEKVKSIPIFPGILECDLVINVPVVKHHVLANGTLCMKNYMGVIENRRFFHQDIATCLADITRFMKPRICILDAMRVLMAHGPKGGKLEDVQVKATVAAGVDIVALDALGAELLGRKPDEVKSVMKGQAAELGKANYRSLNLAEITL